MCAARGTGDAHGSRAAGGARAYRLRGRERGVTADSSFPCRWLGAPAQRLCSYTRKPSMLPQEGVPLPRRAEQMADAALWGGESRRRRHTSGTTPPVAPR